MTARRPSAVSILNRRPSYSSSDDGDDEETEVFIGPVTTKELVIRAEVLSRTPKTKASLNRTFEIEDPVVDAFDASTSVDQELDVNSLDCSLVPDIALAEIGRSISPLSAEQQDEITQEALKIAARLKFDIACYGNIAKENPVCSKKHDGKVVAVEKHPVATLPEVVEAATCPNNMEKKRASSVHKRASGASCSFTPSRIPVLSSTRKSYLPVSSSRKRPMTVTALNEANQPSPSKRRNLTADSMPTIRKSILPSKRTE